MTRRSCAGCAGGWPISRLSGRSPDDWLLSMTGPAGRERIYRFIDSESANFSVARLCQVCGVARSAYYDWLGRERGGPGEALLEEAYLANRVFDIWRRSRRRYGAPRVTAGCESRE